MDDYEEMLMTKAAWHYYFEGITQQQAAERMGISAEQLASLAHSGFATFAEQDLRTWLARLNG